MTTSGAPSPCRGPAARRRRRRASGRPPSLARRSQWSPSAGGDCAAGAARAVGAPAEVAAADADVPRSRRAAPRSPRGWTRTAPASRSGSCDQYIKQLLDTSISGAAAARSCGTRCSSAIRCGSDSSGSRRIAASVSRTSGGAVRGSSSSTSGARQQRLERDVERAAPPRAAPRATARAGRARPGSGRRWRPRSGRPGRAATARPRPAGRGCTRRARRVAPSRGPPRSSPTSSRSAVAPGAHAQRAARLSRRRRRRSPPSAASP